MSRSIDPTMFKSFWPGCALVLLSCTWFASMMFGGWWSSEVSIVLCCWWCSIRLHSFSRVAVHLIILVAMGFVASPWLSGTNQLLLSSSVLVYQTIAICTICTQRLIIVHPGSRITLQRCCRCAHLPLASLGLCQLLQLEWWPSLSPASQSWQWFCC